MRPATPLSVILGAASALLILAALSTPVIKSIPLAKHAGTDFGVWGFCNEVGGCTPIEIGYSNDQLLPTRRDFSLPEDTRHSVSYILVIHPIAAFLSVVSTILAIVSHFHSPAHSPRYLLGLFLVTIPAVLTSLLAFLVDVLLFIPHLSWGSYCVLTATIILVGASIVSCGMRRTLVSRKERRRRIAENAEMNGENYFKQAQMQATIPRADSPPPLSGGSISPQEKEMMGFASFNLDSKPNSDDRTPLNPTSAPTFRTGPPSSSQSDRSFQSRPPGPLAPPSRGPPRDQFGNPIPGYGPMQPPGINPSSSSLNSNRPFGPNSGPPPGGPYGRGGRGYRGVYPPRGGSMRGGPGMRGLPPPGWNNRGRGGMGPGPGPIRGRGGPVMMGRQPMTQSPYDNVEPPRQVSPEAMAGAMVPPDTGDRTSPLYDRTSPEAVPIQPQDYVPPRSAWNQKPSTPPQTRLSPIQSSLPSDNRISETSHYIEDVDPRFDTRSPGMGFTTSSASSAALPATLMVGRPPALPNTSNSSQTVTTGTTSSSRTPPPQALPFPPGAKHASPLSAPPMDWAQQYAGDPGNPSALTINPVGSLDSLTGGGVVGSAVVPDGQRSPTGSETSHYTSISQRDINPNWRPAGAPPPMPQQMGPTLEDVVLNTNPDFQIPRGGGARGRGRGRGRGGGGGGAAALAIARSGVPGEGRYPVP